MILAGRPPYIAEHSEYTYSVF